MLYRVLGGYDGIDVSHRIGGAVDGGLPLFHDFEKGRLGFGGSMVDLVYQDHIGEYGAPVEVEDTALHIEDRGAQYIRGHRVGSELYPGELCVDQFTH